MSDTQVPIQANDAQPMAYENVLKDRDRAADRQKAQSEIVRRMAQLKSKLPARTIAEIERTPSRYLGRRLRAHTGEASLRETIKAHCESCVGYEDLKEQVGGCRSYSCLLWVHRPYQP